MNLYMIHRNVALVALTACCVIGVASAGAETYTLTDLTSVTAKGSDSTAAAINDQGQIAGTLGTSAFRYTSGKGGAMEVFSEKAPGSVSRGFGINASGQVVGDSTFGKNETSRAALFSNGTTIDLGTLKSGGPFSRANCINAHGQVVGFSSNTRDSNLGRAFIVNTANRSRMTDLGTLGGAYAQAWAINDSGFVTGNSQTDSLFGLTHAFIWDAKTGMVDLGTIDGGFSNGTFINAKNHVVGYSTINNVDQRVHAFLYDGKRMLDLGSLAGAATEVDFSYALGVNNFDQVVGYSYLPVASRPGTGAAPLGPWSVAFIYENGLMMNLNDLIGAASENYRLDYAVAINDDGQIVAVAFDRSSGTSRAVLLTPDSSGPLKAH